MEVPESVETVKADDRGRINLGTEYAGERVRVAVLDVLGGDSWEYVGELTGRCSECDEVGTARVAEHRRSDVAAWTCPACGATQDPEAVEGAESDGDGLVTDGGTDLPERGEWEPHEVEAGDVLEGPHGRRRLVVESVDNAAGSARVRARKDNGHVTTLREWHLESAAAGGFRLRSPSRVDVVEFGDDGEVRTDGGERVVLGVETVVRQDRDIYAPQHVPRWWSVRSWIAADHAEDDETSEVRAPLGFDPSDPKVVTDGGREVAADADALSVDERETVEAMGSVVASAGVADEQERDRAQTAVATAVVASKRYESGAGAKSFRLTLLEVAPAVVDAVGYVEPDREGSDAAPLDTFTRASEAARAAGLYGADELDDVEGSA